MIDKQAAIRKLLAHKHPMLTAEIQADILAIYASLDCKGPYSQRPVIVELWHKRAKELNAHLPVAVMEYGDDDYSDEEIVTVAFDDWPLSARECGALSMLFFAAFAYKAKLSRMDADDFDKEYREFYKHFEVRATEAAKLVDKERFFNFPECDADFGRWISLPLWEVEEAVALSLDKNPDMVRIETLEPIQAAGRSPFCEEFTYRVRLTQRALRVGELNEPIQANDYLAWCIKNNLSVPHDLSSLALLYPVSQQNTELEAENEELRKQIESYTISVDQMNPKSRASIYQLLLVMACAKFKHNLAGNTDATSAIAGAFHSYGLGMDLKTIKGWLDRVAADAANEIAVKAIKKALGSEKTDTKK